MACVGRTLAFVSFLLSVTLPIGAVQAQAPDAKAEQPKKKRASAAKKAEDKAAAVPAAEGKKQADPEAVQKSLDSAQKALDGGKAEVAVNQVNALIGVGGLDSRSMARALAVRGQAYRKQGKPAQAISDLQSAIWLKGGLSDIEKATALQARAEAYREAGLGQPPAMSPGKSTSSNISTAAIAERPAAAPAAPAPASGGGFFSNLFGGTPKPAAVEPSPVKAPADPAVSSWSTTGSTPTGAKAATAVAAQPKVAPTPAAPVKTTAVAAPPTAPAAPVATGGFKIQLAAMRTKEEAQGIAERVKREHAAQLGNRSYQVDESRFGNMGVFYRSKFGGFASVNEAKALCAALRGKGIDCLAGD